MINEHNFNVGAFIFGITTLVVGILVGLIELVCSGWLEVRKAANRTVYESASLFGMMLLGWISIAVIIAGVLLMTIAGMSAIGAMALTAWPFLGGIK